MRTITVVILILNLVNSIYSQQKNEVSKPEGMSVFIPQGEFQMKTINGADTIKKTIKIDAFWMSNEITNKEYRIFVDYAKKHSAEEICAVRYKSIVKVDSLKGLMFDTIVRVIDCVKYSEIQSNLIDSFVLEKGNKDYKNYFTDPKYDNYPVVGVSKQGAEFYCIWETKIQNAILEKKHLPTYHDYRLPQEQEWQYVAQQPMAKKKDENKETSIQQVDKGKVNDWGLYHFGDNVSEWIASPCIDKGIIVGGSWKSIDNIYERRVINSNSRENYIGFRVVVTALINDKK